MLASVEYLVEHRLRIRHRRTDDLQHLGGGSPVRQRIAQLDGALRHVCLQPLLPQRVVQRHGGLGGEHAEQVAVDLAETARGAFHVGV